MILFVNNKKLFLKMVYLLRPPPNERREPPPKPEEEREGALDLLPKPPDPTDLEASRCPNERCERVGLESSDLEDERKPEPPEL